MQYEKFLYTVDMWTEQKRKISISHGDLGNLWIFFCKFHRLCEIWKLCETVDMHKHFKEWFEVSHSNHSDQSLPYPVEKCFWLCAIWGDWSILFHCRVLAKQRKEQQRNWQWETSLLDGLLYAKKGKCRIFKVTKLRN